MAEAFWIIFILCTRLSVVRMSLYSLRFCVLCVASKKSIPFTVHDTAQRARHNSEFSSCCSQVTKDIFYLVKKFDFWSSCMPPSCLLGALAVLEFDIGLLIFNYVIHTRKLIYTVLSGYKCYLCYCSTREKRQST